MKTFIGLAVILAVLNGVVYGVENNTAGLLLTSIEESAPFGNYSNTTTTPTTTVITTTPVPTGGHWHVNYTDSKHYCILFDASNIELEVTYPTLNGSHRTVTIKVPGNAEQMAYGSHCGEYNLTSHEINESLSLHVPFGIFEDENANNAILVFHFTRDPNITGDHTLDKSQLFNITFFFTASPMFFPDIRADLAGKEQQVGSNATLHEFSVLKDRSYQCNTATSFKLNSNTIVNTTLKLSNVRAQAFLTNDHFSSPEPCPADAKTSDLVPIIIGAVLAVIVLIVLVAYLVGRARMRRTTYESI